MLPQVINTANAPEAIGCYNQALKVGNTVYLSGQLGINPRTLKLADDITTQVQQMFDNIIAVVHASKGSINNIVKLNIYLTDMANFPIINSIMSEKFTPPYPARSTIGVLSLAKGALVEADAVLILE